MTAPFRARLARPSTWWALMLAVLAYVPALMSSPGRMVADTKLFLYTDPGRVVSDSIWSYDARQFTGSVPHQTIGYLWPSGPWYWLGDAVGLPDWLVHRLWIGTLMFLAGAGVLWLARRLGIGPSAAFAAGVVYQVSPYVLPYVSRTSAMLLPWAGLGWLVGLTWLAARRGNWGSAAAVALVVATVGSPNPTALLMVAPAPVLLLAGMVVERQISWRRAVATALRIAATSVAVSLWWMAAVVIQGRHGAPVLAFSESLESVSYTASSPEVWRQMGYWLSYVRDPVAPTTTAALEMMISVRAIVAGFAITLIGLAGIVVSRWPYRRVAAALVGLGVIVAVGVHPFGVPGRWPSPAMRMIAGDGDGGLALALRSSTRALPLLSLGLALGAAALVETIGGLLSPLLGPLRRGVRTVGAAGIAAIALVAMPSLYRHQLVDPALERDADVPAAWRQAIDALPDDGRRLWVLPGQEFGDYAWGYTGDPPWPGLMTTPLVLRDLLPLGSAAAMDLIDAADNRFQAGVAELAAVAPVARLLAADTIWLALDQNPERYRTPRPGLVEELFADRAADAANGLEAPAPYGDAVAVPASPFTLDEATLTDPDATAETPPVELIGVADPTSIIRAAAATMIVSGSGDGLVDAAAAGLLDPDRAIIYSASLAADQVAALVTGDDGERATGRGGPAVVVVTDANRARAHQWRGTQDVFGYTETGGDPADPDDEADERFDLFGTSDPATQTVAEQRGPVTARATAYGEPFAYRPENRAFAAIDSDPRTAWVVGDRGNPIGESITLDVAEAIDHLDLLQPDGAGAVRHLGDVSIQVDDRPPVTVTLGDESLRAPGQRIQIPPTSGPSSVTITVLRTVVPDPTPGPALWGVGFSEIDLGLAPTVEVVRAPLDAVTAISALGADGADVPVSYVLTRLRHRPTDRWRSDPESTLNRQIMVPEGGDREFQVDVTIRLNARADDTVTANLLGITGATASRRLAGVPTAAGWSATDDDPATAWITPFGQAVGSTLTFETTSPSPTFELIQPPSTAPITRIQLANFTDSAAAPIEIDVAPPDEDGRSTIQLPSPLPAGTVRLTILAVENRTSVDRRWGEPVQLPAGIAEVSIGRRTEIPGTLDTSCRSDIVTIGGQPVPVRLTGTVADALRGDPLTVTGCGDQAVTLPPGPAVVTSALGRITGLDVDRVTLRSTLPAGPVPEAPRAVVSDETRVGRDVRLSRCAQGCWLVQGEGHSATWSASIGGRDLGPPTLIDGGFNGWWIPPVSGAVTVELRWTAQTPLTWGLTASVVAVAWCLLAVFASRRDPNRPGAATADDPASRPRWGGLGPRSPWWAAVGAGAAWVVAAVGFVGSAWALPAAVGGAAIVAIGRPRWAGIVGLAIVAVTAVVMADVVRVERPFPNAGWPDRFAWLDKWGLFAAVAVLVTVFERRPPGDAATPTATPASPGAGDPDRQSAVGSPSAGGGAMNTDMG